MPGDRGVGKRIRGAAEHLGSMRVLFCIPNMAGGGAERQLVYLAGELVMRGLDVHVALLQEGPNYGNLVDTGCTIHRIRARGNHDIAILLRLVRLMRELQPDLVHTWMTQMDVFGGIAASLTGAPFLLSERSCDGNYPRTLKNSLRLAVGRLAAAVISNSPGGSDYWRRKAGDGVKTCMVCNALPVDAIEAIAPSTCGLRIKPDAKVILFAGRFSPEKNISTIIDAFRMIGDEDAILVLCGEGGLRLQIEGAVLKSGLASRVLLPGFVKNLSGLMKRADVLVSVSSFEGLPNVVLEAMACGCPLVLSDIPAHRAFLAGEAAMFVDPGNPSEIAQAIQALIDDPASAETAARKAKSGISSYSITAVVDRYEEIYRSILLQ